MAEFRNGKSFFQALEIDNPAVEPNDAVRKQEMDAAIAAKTGTNHTHTADQITDFASAVQSQIGLYIVDGDTVTWFNDAGTRKAKVRVKAGGGLALTPDGLAADIGPSGTQLAAGNHTHSQLHDPVSISPTNTVSGTLSGQQASMHVLTAGNGGLTAGPTGLAVSFGTGTNQAARGDHTHTDLHPALTVVGTNSLKLHANPGQVLSGTVPLDPATVSGRGKLAVGSDGLYMPLGPSGTQAAAGNHGHQNATQTSSGFLSALDKRKLDQYAALLQVDQSVSFHRPDPLPEGQYVGGRHRWGQSMQILNANLLAQAPASQCILGIEIDGTVAETIEIPGGASNTEVGNFKAFSDVFIEPDKYVRIVGVSGVGDIISEPSKIDVALNVRPTIAQAPTVQVNSGGGEVDPWIADAFYSGGSPMDVSDSIDRSAVTNPAPEAVYQSSRLQLANASKVFYTVTGLGRGIQYKVRLHFAELYFSVSNTAVFHINVIGETTATTGSFNILDQAGAQHQAVVVEHTLKPDGNGQIKVELVPIDYGSGYHCSINGIEMIPLS